MRLGGGCGRMRAMEQGNDTRPVAEGYEILEPLGRGGTSEVWLARQKSLDRLVALKVLGAERLADAAGREAFRREAVAAAKVDLAGVVRVLDFGESADGRLWYAMEYVEGQSLADWLAEHPRMASSEVLTLAGIAADTLGALWRQYGLVHCDVKPGNLLIGRDGSVKLVDFGVARYAGTAGARGDEDLEGTPTYLAPEQIETGAADCRSDMYALGLTLYHALTGCEPFNGRTLGEVLEAQATDYLQDPCELVPDTPTGFAWLLHKLTAKNPELRPETWEDVAKDILQIREGHMPLPPYPKEGESTILLNPERMAGRGGKLSNGTRVVVVGTQTGKWIESHGDAEMKRRRSGGCGKGCLGFLAFVLLLAGVAGWFWYKAGMPKFWEDVGKTPAQTYVEPEEEKTLAVHGSAESVAAVQAAADGNAAAGGEDEPADAAVGPVEVPDAVKKRFVEAADLFNGAFESWLWSAEMDEAARADVLPEIEADARAAAELFEGLAGELPADMPVQAYANQCYQLAKDARKARVPEGERRLAYAGKHHDEKQAPWPTPGAGFLGAPMQLGYAWDYLPVPSGRDDAMEFMMLMIRMGVDAEPSPAGDGGLSLFGPLKWMMPVADAMKALRADPKGVRRHVAEGAVFPFGGVFAREVPAGMAGQGKYGKMRLLTDLEDRLVGLELYEEEPKELLHDPLQFIDGQRALDFVTGRLAPEKGNCRVFQQALQGQGTVRVDCEAADFAESPDAPRPIWRSMLVLPRGLAKCCMYHVLGGRDE